MTNPFFPKSNDGKSQMFGNSGGTSGNVFGKGGTSTGNVFPTGTTSTGYSSSNMFNQHGHGQPTNVLGSNQQSTGFLGQQRSTSGGIFGQGGTGNTTTITAEGSGWQPQQQQTPQFGQQQPFPVMGQGQGNPGFMPTTPMQQVQPEIAHLVPDALAYQAYQEQLHNQK